MSLISISDLSFAYDGSYDYIFEHVSLQLDTDWRLGFTGRNGRGKTTLLRLLMGEYAYQGSITASVEFEYFPYPVADTSRLTMDILEEIDAQSEYWQIARELSLLECSEDILYRPFHTLSNGEQTKALLAVLFLRENAFLLIDEPTNHLDMHGREVLSRYLKTKKGFILISHDRSFLDGCIDHILSINRANIEVQRGNFSSWYVNKERQDSYERAENARLAGEISRLETAIREKGVRADAIEAQKRGSGSENSRYLKSGAMAKMGAKSKKLQSQRKNFEKRQLRAAEEKETLLKNIEYNEELKLGQLTYFSNRLLECRQLSVDYGGGPVFAPVSFTVERGDRIAISGRNGSGKSSLLKLIMGQDIPHSGVLELGSRLKISYVPQDSSDLAGSLNEYALRCGIDETLFKTILRKLDFSRAMFDKDMKDYSGGQKKKVLLARSLCEETHLHVWDEPMNFVDVISRMQLEELLIKYAPTVIFVEHDRAFCERVATKTVVL